MSGDFGRLVRDLGSKDWETRRDAAKSLGELGDVRAVEPLTAALRDTNSGVLRAVQEALRKLRGYVRILIVDDIPETRENLRKMLFFQYDLEVVAAASSGEEGIQFAKEYQPDIVLMDINMPGVSGISATEVILREVPSAQVIMMSVQSEADYLQRSMWAGARDFLIKPFTGDELVATIRRVYGTGESRRRAMPTVQPAASATPVQPEGKLIAVFALKGGVGCTILAVNLAIAMHRATQASVALVDASLQTGDIAVLLNLRPTHSIADLIQQIDDMDSDMLDTVIIPYAGINVLLAPSQPEMADLVSSEHLRRILEQLKQKYDYIIVDTWSFLHDVVLVVLDMTDLIILPTTPDISALRSTRLFLDVAEQLGYPPEKTALVLNKSDQQSDPRASDIEQAVKYPITAEIPLDYATALASVNRGVPLMIRDSSLPISQAIRHLAHKLLEIWGAVPEIVHAIQSLAELQALERLDAYKKNVSLGRALDELERITWGIPHDLKEPLGVARNILDGFSRVSSPAISDGDVLYGKDRLDNALLLVDRLVSVTSCGELEVKTKTPVIETLESACSLIRSNLQSAVDIDILAGHEDIGVQVKDSDLQQIIFCLLENAVEATPEGGTVQVIVEGQADDCHIKVLDSGSGIEGPTGGIYTLGHTTKPGHAGLGLSVCKRIVTRYGGEISVSTGEGRKGTIASVCLPKGFKHRERKQRPENLKEALVQYRDRSKNLSSRERDAVDNLVARILKVFATNLSLTIKDVESIVLSMLKEMMPQDNRERVSLLLTVFLNCAYARSIAESLLEPSRPVQVQPIPLETAFYEVLALFMTKWPKKSDINVRVDDDVWIRADRTQFQRVFFNLTRNALEAMRKSGRFRLTVKAHAEDGFAVVRFKDSGVGISKENLGKIFMRGFTTKERGRGLGLFVAETIIKQHQGRIAVESTEEGVGTCFIIHWPLSPQSAGKAAGSPIIGVLIRLGLFERDKATEKAVLHSPAIPKTPGLARVLIIDDNGEWLKSAVRELQSPDYVIQGIQDPRDAVEFIRKAKCDLVLLDWRMDSMDGPDALKAIQELDPDIPVAILSAHGDVHVMTRAFQLGAREFIHKPFKGEWDSLKQKLLELILVESGI